MSQDLVRTSSRTLLTFAPCFGVRSPSPFTLKVEALLSMADLPYVCRFGTPRDGPRGKLPVLVDDGVVIPDSRMIQRHLEARYGVDFDAGLSPGQRAQAVSLRRLCEEHLYWAQVYFRWMDHPRALRDHFFAFLPRPARDAVVWMLRRQVRRDLHGQGLGRMTRDEIVALAGEDLEALARQLGDQAFMFGDRPTSLDATAYGLLANLAIPELASPLVAPAQDRFGDYLERVEARLLRAAPAVEGAARPAARAA